MYLKRVLAGKLLIASRNWLLPGMVVLPESARSQLSTHQSTENKDKNMDIRGCDQKGRRG